MRYLSPIVCTLLFVFFHSYLLNAQNTVQITRIDGVGAGGTFLEITDATRAAILAGTVNDSITYQVSKAPIDIRIIDSAAVVPGNYELTFIDGDLTNDVLDFDTQWKLTNLNTGVEVIYNLSEIDEVIEVPEFGLEVRITQSIDAGETNEGMATIGASLAYANPGGPEWFSAVRDQASLTNFIKTGLGEPDQSLDPLLEYSSLGDRFWYPLGLCDWRQVETFMQDYITPTYRESVGNLLQQILDLDDLNNVDIVFTSDTSKWSRCLVVETATPNYYDVLGFPTSPDPLNNCELEQFDLRGALSVGKVDNDGDGLPDPDGALDEEGNPLVGMGWFPGYAIDVETGQRLNIFFGENSAYSCANAEIAGFPCSPAGRGDDMLWNPSAIDVLEPIGSGITSWYNYYFGAQQFVYVTKEPYDSCQSMYGRLSCAVNSNVQKVLELREITWTSMPLLADGIALSSLNEGLIPNDLTVKLRVNNPYQVAEAVGPFNGYPTYQFTVDMLTNTTFVENPLDAIVLSPNPYITRKGGPIHLQNVPLQSEIRLWNMNGQLVAIDYEEGSNTVLPKQALEAGLYVLQVRMAGGAERYLKLVVV